MSITEKWKFIGRSEKASFPDFELSRLNAKVDSGAYTSAIHCCKIDWVQIDTLEVVFLDEEDPNYTGRVHRFHEFIKKKVRSSNGIAEERFIIATRVGLGDVLYDINLSLTFRGDMRFPVLIGRRFLSRHHFVINPRLRNSLYKKSLKKF